MKSKNLNINLLTDFGFKRFFGTEPYKKNLISFLNAFVPPYIGHVEDVTFLPTEQLGNNDTNKRLVFDVLCASQNNDHIIVEMQKASQEFFKDRIIAYSSRHISEALEVGDRRYSFPIVLTIVLVDFEIPELKGSVKFLQHVMLKDDENQKFSDKMSFLLIDLTKFAGEINFEQLSDEIQKWCYVIKNMWRLKESDIPAEETVFRELYENCKISKLNAMEKQEYEKSVLEYEDVKDAMEYHHRMGKAEGLNEGFVNGFEKGVEKGREEAIIQTVKNLLSMGMSASDIAKATGLTENEVIQLEK
ncbi:MAG: Rpn family recombination-promoting nuclease/putative transposase [Bacteroidales bacterium]|nr:Rpn family recombination-promoting nuclease/putative transposase [Bacteroidales bacterium]